MKTKKKYKTDKLKNYLNKINCPRVCTNVLELKILVQM